MYKEQNAVLMNLSVDILNATQEFTAQNVAEIWVS